MLESAGKECTQWGKFTERCSEEWLFHSHVFKQSCTSFFKKGTLFLNIAAHLESYMWYFHFLIIGCLFKLRGVFESCYSKIGHTSGGPNPEFSGCHTHLFPFPNMETHPVTECVHCNVCIFFFLIHYMFESVWLWPYDIPSVSCLTFPLSGRFLSRLTDEVTVGKGSGMHCSTCQLDVGRVNRSLRPSLFFFFVLSYNRWSLLHWDGAWGSQGRLTVIYDWWVISKKIVSVTADACSQGLRCDTYQREKGLWLLWWQECDLSS